MLILLLLKNVIAASSEGLLAKLGDIVKANEALGTPPPPKEDMLTKLQNLEMYKNRPSRKK